MTTHDRLTVTDEMLAAYQDEYLRCFREGDRANNRKPLQAVLDLIADTAPSPDPRTDLAGYLGLTDDQAEDCRRRAPFHPGSVYTKVGARLIEQDQARADEPDDGLIPVTVRLTAEEVRARQAIDRWPYQDKAIHRPLAKLDDACRAIDLPAPKLPWKSPLADLPDLTEQEARYIVQQFTPADLGMDEETQRRLPLTTNAVRKIAKALIAAGWTPEEEA